MPSSKPEFAYEFLGSGLNPYLSGFSQLRHLNCIQKGMKFRNGTPGYSITAARLSLLMLAFFCGHAQAALELKITLSHPSPQPVGTKVTLVAEASGASAENVRYRFRRRDDGGEFTMVRDFGPTFDFDWTKADYEGRVDVEVSARNLSTGETSSRIIPFEFTARTTSAQPVVSGTHHPLVFLYSFGQCPAGSLLSVRYSLEDGSQPQQTREVECDGVHTVNTYLAGLRPESSYRANHFIRGPQGLAEGGEVTFKTEAINFSAPARSVAGVPLANEGFILHGPVLRGSPFAADLEGNIVWYYTEPISWITRPSGFGRYLGLRITMGDRSEQFLREFDVAGMTLKETNAEAVNEQLQAMGKRIIGGFHHEAARLADGKIVALASVEQFVTDVQAPGTVNVVGDMVIVLDDELRVLWTWDAFDHLDLSRAALQGEKCMFGGCVKTFLDKEGLDWTHMNSVQPTPDGGLVLSSRHQDWLIKIDYADGTGNGAILWRLGKEGDFQIESDDPYPWFSHQHDAQFLDGQHLLVFDNGNARQDLDIEGMSKNSRGQVFALDENARSARLVLNVDLQSYSFAMGNSQMLSSGGFHFNNSWTPSNESVAYETDASGQIVYGQTVGLPVYRSFRLHSLN